MCGDDAARRARNGDAGSSCGGSGEYGGGLPRSARGAGGGATAKMGMFAVYERARPLRKRVCVGAESELVRERVRGGDGGGRAAGVEKESPELGDDCGDGEELSGGGTSGVSTLRRTADELWGCVSMAFGWARMGRTHE